MPLPSHPNTASSSSALGIPIACYRDATATREYLKLLENEPEEQFITRLMEQDKEGGSAVGMIIARHQDATTTQAYLRILENALENGKLTLEQFTMLLMQQSKEGGSMGMFIALNQDAATTQAYLQLLENALENRKLTSEQFTMLLMQQNKEGGSVGMIIAHYRDATTTQAYLQLLKNALETENISNFFKSSPLSLLPINKSRKIQITSKQLQELESLIPPNQQHNDVKESIVALINEFNKGSITKESLFEKLRNSIDEGNPEYLFVERAMTSSTPSPATQRRKM